MTGNLPYMRSVTYELAQEGQSDELLTTGEAATLLNVSRQHIVDLCTNGDLPFSTVGTHRRVRRVDLVQLRSRTERLTRDQERSLWLGHAIAGKLVADPTWPSCRPATPEAKRLAGSTNGVACCLGPLVRFSKP
jgi:excisionase family DNA binding protein